MSDTPAANPKLPFPLQEGESVVELRRRHWWFLWPQTLLFVISAFLPIAFVAVLLDLASILDDLGIFFWLVAGLWVAYWVVRGLLNWYRYSHDIWVVTNQRLIDSFKAHPLNLRVATADLVNVQDMTVSKNGFLATILNFGNVDCETAGSDQADFMITGIPHPEELQLLIDKERDRERARLAGPGSATTNV